MRYFNQALQLLDQLPAPDPALAVDLRLDLGIAQRQAGTPDFRETLLDAAHRAQALGDPDRLVKAALGNNRGLFSAAGVVDEERVAVLESALEMFPPGDSPDRAVLLATLCSELAYGPLDRRLAVAQRSHRDRRTPRGPRHPGRREQPATAGPHDPRHPVRSVAHRRAEPWRSLRTWASRPGYSGRPAPTTPMPSRPGNSSARRATSRPFGRLSQRLRQPVLVWVATYLLAGEALVRGDHEEAEELANRALEIGYVERTTRRPLPSTGPR